MSEHADPCAWCGGEIVGPCVTVRATDRPEFAEMSLFFPPCGFFFCESCGFVATHDRGRMLLALDAFTKTADAVSREVTPWSWLELRGWERGRGGRWADPTKPGDGFVWTLKGAVRVQSKREAERARRRPL